MNEWKELTNWDNPDDTDCLILTIATEEAGGFDELCRNGAKITEPGDLSVIGAPRPLEVELNGHKFFWRYCPEDNQPDIIKAASDRWGEFRYLMNGHPEVDWARASRLAIELNDYRRTGQLDFRDEEEMERRGL